jgi:hypothetical protein
VSTYSWQCGVIFPQVHEEPQTRLFGAPLQVLHEKHEVDPHIRVFVWSRISWGYPVCFVILRAEQVVGCSSMKPRDEWQQESTTSIVESILDATDPCWKKGIRSMLLLACWEIWQERNNYTFKNKMPSPAHIIKAIHDTIQLWRLSGAKCLSSPFGDVT